MKKIIHIFSTLVIILAFTSCDDQDLSPIGDESSKPIVTATSAVSSINEAGSPVVSITINFDKPIKTTTSFTASQVGGTASESDFTLSNAVVPAYQTSTTMEVVINDDITPEESETIELQIVASTVSDFHEVIGSPTVSLTIENSTTDEFVVNLNWDGEYVDSDGDPHSICDFDMDFEIYNEDFTGPIDASYNNCPEEIRVSPGSLDDGNYWLVPSFWTSASGVPPAQNLVLPVLFTLSQPGVALETIDLTGTWNTNTGGQVQGNPDAYLFKYVLTVSGTSYTVTDNDSGTVVFSN
ncbi:hypothetical protein [uncultured Algibacter sp.]|uniref:hypothetical protein n=1 Tax=uncultured Algibacter sp. TaxID=298659 RepID=UPI00261691D7|nr:hypothetical protein [uncultured Algibacter sp.]